MKNDISSIATGKNPLGPREYLRRLVTLSKCGPRARCSKIKPVLNSILDSVDVNFHINPFFSLIASKSIQDAQLARSCSRRRGDRSGPDEADGVLSGQRVGAPSLQLHFLFHRQRCPPGGERRQLGRHDSGKTVLQTTQALFFNACV